MYFYLAGYVNPQVLLLFGVLIIYYKKRIPLFRHGAVQILIGPDHAVDHVSLAYGGEVAAGAGYLGGFGASYL